MTNKMNKGGAKLESMLMLHDVVLSGSDDRAAYICSLTALLADVDPKRFAKLQRIGVL